MKITKSDVIATGKPRFVGWNDVPESYKTKTQWGEAGMKLQEIVEPSAYVYINGRNEHYELYVEDAMTPKKTIRAGKALPMTPDNIGAALFEINKAAKRRRDAASTARRKRRHGAAGAQKAAKEDLYDLKDRVLEKAHADGWAQLVGYHVKTDSRNSRVWKDDGDNDHAFEGWADDGDDNFDDDDNQRRPNGRWILVVEKEQTAMALYEISGFPFHTILDAVPTNTELEIKDLGEWMSRATPCAKLMTIKNAEATLEEYLRQEKIG